MVPNLCPTYVGKRRRTVKSDCALNFGISETSNVHRLPSMCDLCPFHGENRGSIPLGRANKIRNSALATPCETYFLASFWGMCEDAQARSGGSGGQSS